MDAIINLEPLQEKNLDFVVDIYNHYTKNTTVVYFIEPISKEDVRQFLPIGNATYKSFLVRNAQNEPCGFCYFNKVKPRPAFNISVELTLYLHPAFTGKGLGTQIVVAMEHIIRQDGFKNIVALVSSENTASRHLFEKNYYDCVGELKGIAEKFGRRLDLRYYQKNIT